MYGAILGDIVGSVWEKKTVPFNVTFFNKKARFTDDTVLTIATMDALINDKPYHEVYKNYYEKYPGRGYGRGFSDWAISKSKVPYNSYGNGSSMRVSPIGWFFNSESKVIEEAEKSSSATHNHEDSILWSKAVAVSVFIAREEHSKEKILDACVGLGCQESYCGLEEYHQEGFASAKGTVPKAINCFLRTRNFEECLRTSLLCGGDVDTIASISCAIAEAYYSCIPESLKSYCISKIHEEDFYSVFKAFQVRAKDKHEGIFDFF